MFFDKISQAQDLIAKRRPELMENRQVYEAILQFYSDNSLTPTSILDLMQLLKNKKIEAYKTNAKTFKECVYNLLDEFPELTSAKGMLRYYEAAPNFDWRECEYAEIALGEALTQDIYGWQPDFWTLFERKTENADTCGLTVVAAFY
ncbi:MAG: hypothetical protein FWH22_05940 [Fibromonadales bacterium]|nr:hypothetical protein [Fibromonadales bacterium]